MFLVYFFLVGNCSILASPPPPILVKIPQKPSHPIWLGVCHYFKTWILACNASWVIVFRYFPWTELFALWYLHVFNLCDFPVSFIWRPVPRQYFIVPSASGCIRVLSFNIASRTGGRSVCCRGSTLGQSIEVRGSLSSVGNSKQPRVLPNASSLTTGYLTKLCLK